MRAASPEFKNAVLEACPNEYNLSVDNWLKIASKQLDLDYTRLMRLWRDNRAKPEPDERIKIEDALESARLLREIKKQKLRAKYLQHIISGEIHEHQKNNISQGFEFGDEAGNTFA